MHTTHPNAYEISKEIVYIRRPLPSPRQGRRLGPPQVWNLFLSACLQTPTTIRGSFDPALHSQLLLRHSSLPFASLQMPKMLRGSFDQALWPEAFVVRAFKPAVCLHSHLLLGRSSLPFARLQMPKMLRGSFDGTLARGICC